MFIPDPDLYASRIPDKKNSNKREGSFFCCHKFHKIVNYFIFELLKNKVLANLFSKNYRTFYPKNCHQARKNMGLGSGIGFSRIPDQGSNRHLIPDPGSESATLVPSCAEGLFLTMSMLLDPDPHCREF
jgi:hypothetical protein